MMVLWNESARQKVSRVSLVHWDHWDKQDIILDKAC